MLDLYNPDGNTINALRDLVASGQIRPEDLQNIHVSDQGNPMPIPKGMPRSENTLADMIRALPDVSQVMPGNSNWNQLPSGFGVVSMTDPDGNVTRTEIKPASFVNHGGISGDTVLYKPQNQTAMQVYGAGDAGVQPLGKEYGMPVIDNSRPPIDIPGIGRAQYGKDGNAYGTNPDGSRFKVVLGYDAAASNALQDRKMMLEKFASEQRQRAAQTAFTEAQTMNANLKDMGPKPPADMRVGASGEFEVIPNSKLDMKQRADKERDTNALNTMNQTSKSILDNIDQLIGNGADLKEHPGMQGSVGYLDSKLFPFSESQADAQAKIKALLSKGSVEGLQTLRQSGTAPGSITEKEWPIFQNYIATLDPSQSEASFRQQLIGLRNFVQERQKNVAGTFAERWGEPASPNANIPDGAIQKLRSDPRLRNAFDMKYGAGSAAKVLGQ